MKLMINASRLVSGECRDQADGGSRKERSKGPSGFPVRKDRRRHVGGRGGGEEPSACLSQGTFDVFRPKVPQPTGDASPLKPESRARSV